MSRLNVSNIMSLTGQVALVTGGGTGIGFMIAKGFAANGAKVYITGRREEVLRKAAVSLPASEGVLIPLVMDVTDQASIDKTVKSIQATDGRLDILVNNASGSAPKDFLQKKFANHTENKDPLEHESFQVWTDIFGTNISAPFFTVSSFLPLLIKGAGARESTAVVINVGSVAAFIRSWITVNSLAYSASKLAEHQVSIGLATDFARRGIPVRVNVIHPGVFPTESFPSGTLDKLDTPLPGMVAPTPLGRAGTEEEMVMTAVYLAACTYANGASVVIDGGLGLVNP